MSAWRFGGLLLNDLWKLGFFLFRQRKKYWEIEAKLQDIQK